MDTVMDTTTFTILGFVFATMAFTSATVCMVKIQKIQKSLKEKGIVTDS